MSTEPDFDVVVVGAGIAGSVAAYRLAGHGLSVALIERGLPGSKNLSGGVLYGSVLEDVFPGFADSAPVERRITRHVTTFLTPDSAVALDYSSDHLAGNAVTVLRARFDPWLAGKAEEAGAFLMPEVRVDALLTEPGPGGTTVVGVRAGDDELRARVVVAADGVNSFLATSVGLRRKPPTNHLAVGVKAVVRLPRSDIESRFGVSGDQGAAHGFVGDCTLGIGGGGDGFMSNRGAGNMLTRTTAVLAAMFMTTSLVLGILASRGGSADSVLDRVAPLPQELSDDVSVPAPLGSDFTPAPAAPATPEPAEPSVPRAE